MPSGSYAREPTELCYGSHTQLLTVPDSLIIQTGNAASGSLSLLQTQKPGSPDSGGGGERNAEVEVRDLQVPLALRSMSGI